MSSLEPEFERIVVELVGAFLLQGGRNVEVAILRRFATQLHALILERGLPPPLRPGEQGAPGWMSDDACAPLVARVVEGLGAEPRLQDAARQLVKACFYPEFLVCRDSYKERGKDGRCRRQELERVRDRISGAHCVDCPHWVALSPATHAALLAQAWQGDRHELAAHQEVFLPERFRALRCWLHAAARR